MIVRLFIFVIGFVVLIEAKPRKAHNNVLLILADDLGYGDTSVSPFTGNNIHTPNLQRMADKGTILTNYHTAASTCSPTRASILTGMYPWRMGMKAVFEYGVKGNSNRDDWLPPVPTLPMVLNEANYTVFHSGKWHLGGMRLDDLNMRLLPDNGPTAKGSKRCPHPGPNQQGFPNYASVLDGPGSPRQNRLQLDPSLYSKGCAHMLYNDLPVGAANATGFLSKCEAEHAMRAMELSVANNVPFYIQVWFHCPHGPLEEVPGWRHLLPEKARQKSGLSGEEAYVTMIADMDEQIGKMLALLEKLGIEKDTLVVFTSDNGPENFAGKTAGFRERKRFLYEGGIRVPAIAQWVGTLPAKVKSDAFVVSTDLFPTFLDAAGVHAPSHYKLDGLSILPQLVPDYYKSGSVFTSNTAVAPHRALSTKPTTTSAAATTTNTHNTHTPNKAKHVSNFDLKNDADLCRIAVRDRVTLRHNDYDGQRRTLAWVYDYKVFLNEKEVMFEMFDMVNDPFEKTNLLAGVPAQYWAEFKFTNETGFFMLHSTPAPPVSQGKGVTLDMILHDRRNPSVHLWVASHMYRVLKDYATYGNVAHAALMTANPGWHYTPTLDSDYRMVGKRPATSPRVTLEVLKEHNTCGAAPCSCAVRSAHDINPLPYNKLADGTTCKYIQPGRILDGSKLLKLKRTEHAEK